MGREPVSAVPWGKESVLADSGWEGEMVGGPAGVISVRALKVKECG